MPEKKARKPVIKLRECPWCGFEDARLDKMRMTDDGPLVYVIDCDNCYGSGPVMGGNADRARVAWNHRTGPPEKFTAEHRGVPEAVEPPPAEEIKTPEAKLVESAVGCPFCGCVEVLHEEGIIGRKKQPYYYTYCTNCEACGPHHDTSAGFAALGWNTRFTKK